jgi:hypothetical protein
MRLVSKYKYPIIGLGAVVLLIITVPVMVARNATAAVAAMNVDSMKTPVYADPYYPYSLFRDLVSWPPKHTDEPFLWLIPYSGGKTVEKIINSCYHLKSARDFGIDTTKIEGLKRMQRFELQAWEEVYFFFSSYVHQAASILNENSRGRLFAVFRSPHDRLLSEYGTAVKTGIPSEISNMTFTDYVSSPYHVGNWMTRSLVNKPTQPLTDVDLTYAKQIIRRMCLILLYDKLPDGMKRVQTYFQWNNTEGDTCISDAIQEDPDLTTGAHVNPGSWLEANDKDSYDISLYQYITLLYAMQGEEIAQNPPFSQAVHLAHVAASDP